MLSRWKTLSIMMMVLFAITIAVSCSAGSTSDPDPDPIDTKNYTVTFDAAGGTPQPAIQALESGKMAVRPEPNPVKEDFFFAGWYTSSGDQYNFNVKVVSNITLTAKWQCSVTLNTNGGLFTGTDKTSENFQTDINTKLEVPTVEKTVLGETWNLLGWSLDASETPPVLFDTESGTDKSITLYAVWTQSLVVSFDLNGGYPTPVSQAIEAGYTAIKPSSNPSKSGYLFRFWSADGTTEFDFSTPITKKIELKAVYGLNISTVSVDNRKREITVALARGALKPDPADIWFMASVDGGDPIPVTTSDFSYNSTFRKALYKFESFVSSSTTAALSVVITAHSSATSESASDYTIPILAPVANLKAATDDQAINLTWDDDSFFIESFRLVYTDSSAQEQEITLYPADICKAGKATYKLTGLKNAHSYTFNVYRTDYTETESATATVSATPSISVKNSDWLFVMYLDGDNNLHDYLWTDLNEMEHGLANITSGATVNVVVLWDGWTGNGEETPQYASAHTKIYELGLEDLYEPNTALSPLTIDYTYTADWITDNEVDMSSKTTLENFLSWTKARYTSDKIVLGFSNHGGGPRSAPIKIVLPDGRKMPMPSGRAMCWDETSGGTTFLSTKDVSDALTNQGFTGENKLSMIFLDVCLGGSVEEAYQYRNNAEYFVASPNNIPGGGFDYSKIIKQLTQTNTPSEVGKQLVSDYHSDYYNSADYWIYLATTQYECPLEEIDWVHKGATLSCVNLSGMDTLKTKIDALATIILGSNGDKKWADENGVSTEKTRRDMIRDGILRYNGLGAYMAYMGTYTWLYDIGYVADLIQLNFKSGENNSWPELCTAADEVLTALKGAVAWADKDAYNSDYQYSNRSAIFPEINRGLTICGETTEITISGGTGTIKDGFFPDFYTTTNLEFASSSWATLLDKWFPNK